MKPVRESDKELHMRVCAMQSSHYEDVKLLVCGDVSEFTHTELMDRLKDLVELAEEDNYIKEKQAEYFNQDKKGDYDGYN
jgi:hypothetical protein